MPPPLVSVVIPSFNRLELLRQCLASVAAQTFADWECIVCDDGSSDGTHEFVEALGREDPRFRLSLGERFGHPGGPRNRGIGAATGRWVAFLDDDDLWHPEKLAVQCRLAAATKCDAISVCYLLFPSGGVAAFPDGPLPTAATPISLLHVLRHRSPFPATPSNMIRRDALLQAGGFAESRAYRGWEDFDLWCRLLGVPGFVWVIADGVPLVAGREDSPGSISSWKAQRAPDFARQGWAGLEVMTRAVASSMDRVGGTRAEAAQALYLTAVEAAVRSYVQGWRTVSASGYALAAVYAAVAGRPLGALRELYRGVRLGLLAKPGSAPVPPEVGELRRAALRSTRNICLRRAPSAGVPLLSADGRGGWSSLRSTAP